MSAAIAQGVVASTVDIDLWIDLPPRQYMRVQNLAARAGATPAANTVVYLENGIPVNFIYEVAGLRSFRAERKRALIVQLHGRRVPVLPLDRIEKSKRAVGRDKDLLHLRLFEEFRRCRASLHPPRRGG